jgi:hypothetical protein
MPKSPKRVKLQGKVVAFNISPKRQVEGALVETARPPSLSSFRPCARTPRVGGKGDKPESWLTL